MTCIVGLVHDGKTYIGADSLGVKTPWLQKTDRKDPKVFENNGFVIGFTSSFRMGQVLAHSFNPPKVHADDNLFRYMVTDFIDAVRSTLKSAGYARRDNDVESGGEFLVGYRNRLFQVCSDYQVAENRCGYAAVGCGAEFAMGSLHATQALGDLHPQEEVLMALEAAVTFSAGVGGELTCLST